jgi:hypothetical protein
MGKDISTRRKSPNQVTRDQIIKHYKCGEATNSPQKKKFASRLVSTLAMRIECNHMKIYRWLDDPDRYPLSWEQLQEVAQEVGGSVRVLFSFKRN